MNAAALHYAVADFESGLRAYEAKRYDEALALLSDVTASDPSHIEARHVLALTQRALKMLDAAAVNLSEVIRCQPKNAEAWSNFGAILRESGRLFEALEALEASLEFDPKSALAQNNIGTVLLDLGRVEEARDAFQRAINLRPDYPDALANLGRALFECGDVASARQVTRSALALNPDHCEALNGLSFVCAAIGDVESALGHLEAAAELDPTNGRIQSNVQLRSLAMDSLTAAQIRDRAEAWGRAQGPSRRGSLSPNSIATIGFVSSDLRQHPVGLFAEPVIAHLGNEFRVVCYSSKPHHDAVTERIKGSVAEWRDIAKQDASRVADQIAADGVDLLIDLSGHTADNRLDVFALKPAPLQMTWLGYSGTTGLPQMDFLLADPVVVPEEHEALYSERVVRMPHSFACSFLEPRDLPRAQNKGGVVFGVFNNPSKFSRSCYRMWAEILRRQPGSRLLFKYQLSGDRWVQRQLLAKFDAEGIATDRIDFSPYVSQDRHLEILAGVDLALDTFPYSGATTTLDCLIAGTPVVTLTGGRYSARMSASFMTALGVTDTVCQDESNYVATALELANDPLRLNDIRDRIRRSWKGSPLCDVAQFQLDFAALVQSLPAL
ncbi:MAG: tetratricopeptide repeat protein [Armatimonadetes bacterium]|nr:tetratricopeptide repeat protein [Armatimonadota bacterium]